MNILLAEKVIQYISSLPADKNSIYLKQLNMLKGNSKDEIIKMKDVVNLSKNEAIEFFGYYIVDSTYIVFAFNNTDLIIIDVIELQENKVNSLILTSEENGNDSTT